jgi:hypothetical protein
MLSSMPPSDGEDTPVADPWGRPRVYIEGYGGGQFITDADEVAYFGEVYDEPARLALSWAASVEFIRQFNRMGDEAMTIEWRRSRDAFVRGVKANEF